MKLATTTGDFSGYASTQTESMQYIREAGFRFMDYNFGSDYSRRDGFFAADWKNHLEQVKKKADELGAAFIQAHSPMGRPLADKTGEFTEDTARCVEACGLLGIKNIVVHSGYLHGISKEETFERNKKFYERLFPTAEKYGVNILVENFNKMCVDGMYWIDNAADQRALIDYVDHPLFHGCWDAGHGNMQEMSQDESLRILGEHVYALHIQDNLGNSDSHLVPFFGTLNMDAVMHGLADIGYKGYFTFEAGSPFLAANKRRPFEKDTRLARAPLGLRIASEKLLYEIGRYTLEAYDCFEE